MPPCAKSGTERTKGFWPGARCRNPKYSWYVPIFLQVRQKRIGRTARGQKLAQIPSSYAAALSASVPPRDGGAGCRWSKTASAAIDFAPMSHVHNEDDKPIVLDLVQDPIFPPADDRHPDP